MEYPNLYPAAKAILTDDDGNLWVQEYPEYGSTDALWHVLSPAGRGIARIVVPAATRILDVRRGCVLVMRTNELDVEVLAVYELVREGRGDDRDWPRVRR